MLHAIASAFIGVAAFISSLFGAVPQQQLGAALPSGTAVFETSLQSRISSTDTSLTLTANSVRGGSALTGYNCFTLDEGRTDAEYACGTVSGTSVTSLTRGVDPSTGTTSNSALKFAHRVGANVKITDFPLIQILRNQANGSDTYPNPLRYAAGVAPSTVDDLTDKGYVDGIAFSGAGVIDASSIARGVVELATGAEAAASTASGSSGTLALPASLATSTYNNATAGNVIPVTDLSTKKLADNFISTSTLLSATSTISIGAFPAWQIGKQFKIFTSVGTSTFSVPSGITKVEVETQGAGGGGGSCAGSAVAAAGGGGAGGYANKIVDVTGTSTIQVFVGTGGASATAGTWSTFGTNGFYTSASGGSAGANDAASTAKAGGAGGVGSGGDFNLAGQDGGGNALDVATSFAAGGTGGTSHFGGGGRGGVVNSNGVASGNYGGGGGGCSESTNAAASGGAGAQGIVIVRW